MRKSVGNIFIVGFALFSMLFGAGNVIFPPYLGLSCGAEWMEGFAYYYIADIGLAMTCLFAIQRCGGYQGITGHLGKGASELLVCIIILCIGPMVGIPRTAASTFEMAVVPLLPGVHPVAFSFGFFAMIALLCLKESSVVDLIGKILTPILLVGLSVLIFKGVSHPIAPISQSVMAENVPFTGIKAGYQTMDVLAVVIFGILISKTIQAKGYTRRSQQNTIIGGAGVVAGVSLLLIYLGLTYLGATTSGMFELSVNYTFLVTFIVKTLLGKAGTVLFAVVVALACITTAVALVSACSDYFVNLTGGRIHYVWTVAAICAFSSVVTTLGLDYIISVASPILDVVYPPTLLIVLMSYLDRWIKRDWVFRLGALAAALTSLMTVLQRFGAPLEFINILPFQEFGFGWVVPALVFSAVGFLIPAKSHV